MDPAGRFITIEGLEGAGKTTSIGFVADWLRARGIDPLLTREPGGTELGEAIRGLLLGHRHHGMAPDAEALLAFASRAEHLARVIEPALAAGRWVICDRFTDATYAYQGGGRGLGANRIAVLEDWTQGDRRPDLTLFLDVPVAAGLARAAERSAPDRFESERAGFFERARAVYLERCAADPERMRRVDAAGDLASVRAEIERQLAQAFPHP